MFSKTFSKDDAIVCNLEDQPFEIFAEKEEDLISQMVDDLLLRYENMKLDNFIKEIRGGLGIK